MLLTGEQLKKLGLEPYTRVSPLLTKCCLRVCANSSYQNAATDLQVLMGIEIGHSSLQRYVQRQEFPCAEPNAAIEEISLDGGKVRLRSPLKGQKSYWRDYKAARLNGTYFGAWFQDNLALTTWINAQRLNTPLICLGDGHQGIWNLFAQIATTEQRWEIIDWFHLKENLYKVGGSLKRLQQAEDLLWHGDLSAVKLLFAQLRRKEAQNFGNYLDRHDRRLVNYNYCQNALLNPIPIGSGAVESAVKQLDRRLKLSGAQWKPENVNQVLALRCSYLNGFLDAA